MLSEAARMRGEIEPDNGGSAVRLAVQAGIERGRKRSWQGRFTTGSFIGLAAAALAAVILFFIPMLQDSAPRTSAPPEPVNWGALEMFKRLYSFDLEAATLDSAIRNDYMQLINQTAASGDYQVTLNAVTADENRIIFLYTAKVAESQEVYGFSSARMKDMTTGQYLENGGGIGGGATASGPLNNRIYYGRSIINLDRNEPFPEQLEADFQIASVDPGMLGKPKTGTIVADMHYSPRMKISFRLDPRFKRQQTIIVQPEEDFMLDGIEVTLAKVEISPLLIRTEVHIKKPSDVTWQNRQKVFLAAGGGEVQSVTRWGTVKFGLTSGAGTEEGFERRFGSNLLDQPESVNLILKTDTGQEKKELNLQILPE